MKEENQLESGFKIINLLLMESNFKREVVLTLDQSKKESLINVDVNVEVKDQMIYVTETLDFTLKYEGTTELSVLIRMIGVFEKFGNNVLNMKEFGEINGAAIIFPYIREQLTSLSAKSGIGLIILPPFNFTKKKS